MRGLFNSAYDFTFDILKEIAEATEAHFGNHIGGSLSGVYIRVPITRLTAFLSWREQSLGLGHERSDGALEVFAGRFQGIFCVEPLAV